MAARHKGGVDVSHVAHQACLFGRRRRRGTGWRWSGRHPTTGAITVDESTPEADILERRGFAANALVGPYVSQVAERGHARTAGADRTGATARAAGQDGRAHRVGEIEQAGQRVGLAKGGQGDAVLLVGHAVARAQGYVRFDLAFGRLYAVGQASHVKHGFFIAGRRHDVRASLVLDALDGGALGSDYESDDSVGYSDLKENPILLSVSTKLVGGGGGGIGGFVLRILG